MAQSQHLKDKQADAQAKGRCGQFFRRNMYEAPFSRVCLKEPHDGHRHSDNPALLHPKKPEGPKGTCQACFRNDLKMPKGHMSKHGYQRPGHGYIIGGCIGSHELPYEQSCEVTKRMVEVVKNYKAQQEAYLARVEAGEVELTYVAQVYTQYSRESENFTVAVGSEATVAESKHLVRRAYNNFQDVKKFEALHGRKPEEGKQLVAIPSYEDVQARVVGEVKASVQSAGLDIVFFQGKVDAWVLVE